MNMRTPPRYLPTLTEVVDPSLLPQPRPAPVPEPVPAAQPEPLHQQGLEAELAMLEPAEPVEPVALQLPPAVAPEPTVVAVPVAVSPPISHAPPDRQALAQQLIRLVKPQLEAELRSLAQELFEAQFSALLPSMHLHIEEAVREALEQALPEDPDTGLP